MFGEQSKRAEHLIAGVECRALRKSTKISNNKKSPSIITVLYFVLTTAYRSISKYNYDKEGLAANEDIALD